MFTDFVIDQSQPWLLAFNAMRTPAFSNLIRPVLLALSGFSFQLLFLFTTGVYLTILSALFVWSANAAQPGLTTHFDGRLLTIEARGIPIGELLDELGDVTGIDFRLMGSRKESVSLARTTGTLENILKKLAPRFGIAMIYRQSSLGIPAELPCVVYVAPQIMNASSGSLWNSVADLGDASVSDANAYIETPVIQEIYNQFFQVGQLENLDFGLLKAYLTKPNDTDAHLAAVNILGSLPEDERVLELLLQALHDDASKVKMAAAYALCNFGISGSDHTLEKAYQSPDPEVRLVVLNAIAIQSTEKAEIFAYKGLADTNTRIRLASLGILANALSGSERIFDPLATALTDPDASVREAAEHYLNLQNGFVNSQGLKFIFSRLSDL